jgi:hypothetical protein
MAQSKTQSIKVIVKIEKTQTGYKPVLFFPEYIANPGFIACWTYIDSHGEACMDYYRGLKNPASTPEQISITEHDLRVYAGAYIDKHSERLIRVKRDSESMRVNRWISRANKVFGESKIVPTGSHLASLVWPE